MRPFLPQQQGSHRPKIHCESMAWVTGGTLSMVQFSLRSGESCWRKLAV